MKIVNVNNSQLRCDNCMNTATKFVEMEFCKVCLCDKCSKELSAKGEDKVEKLTKVIFESGLEVVLEGQKNSFIVYLFDTFHNERLNVRTFKDYEKALKNYNARCIGL